MINFTSYKIKQATTSEIKNFYNPIAINKLCFECNKYNKVWSCPPLPFKDIKYLEKYKYCYLISGKVYINKISQETLAKIIEETLNKYSNISTNQDEFSDIFNALYYKFREFNDLKILSLENIFPNTLSLSSGRCLLCETCTRAFNKPCIKPKKLRYSLESLGFDVSGIIENILRDKIQWSNDTKPEYITCVSALLSNYEINPDKILYAINS